jgi:hypothetical protein
MRKKLGALLVERGLIRPSDLEEALRLQQRTGVRLGTALLQQDKLTEPELIEALGELLGIPSIDLSQVQPDPAALTVVSPRFASEHDLFPLRIRVERGRRVLTLAMVDPTDVRTIDELGFMCNARIEPLLAAPSDVDRTLRQHFGTRFGVQNTAAGTALRIDTSGSTMTILRRGGGEEEVDTGSVQSTSEPAEPANPSNGAEARASADPSTAPPAILLTDQMRRNAMSPRVSPAPSPPAVVLSEPKRSAPSRAPSHAESTEWPTPEAPTPNGRTEALDAVEALVSKSGQTVDAELVLRMEKRFWALMRVLARKGLITKEDFLRELGEDSTWSGGD